MSKKNGATKVDLEGAKEFQDLLRGLPLELQGKILKNINREGAKIVQAEMIRNSPPGSEIPDNIKIRSDKDNITGVIIRPTKDVFYARFLEYGTAQRTTEKGANRGSETPRPFLKRSIDNVIDQVIKHITEGYGELVEKYMKKELKRLNRIIKKNGIK